MRGLRIRLKVWQLLAVVGLLVTAAFSFAFVSHRALYALADKAWRDGEYEKATALFDRFMERCPDCPETPEVLARTAGHFNVTHHDFSYLLQTGQYAWRKTSSSPTPAPDAEWRYRRLIEKFPEHALAGSARENLALKLYAEQRFAEAKVVLTEALESADTAASGATNTKHRLQHLLLLVEHGLGNYETVIELASVPMSLPPHLHAYETGRMLLEHHLALADAHYELGQGDEAARHYAKADDLYARFGRTWTYSGYLDVPEPTVLRGHQVKMEREGTGGTIAGQIVNAGDPLPPMDAFIGHPNVLRIGGLLPNTEEILLTSVNENGTFKFEHVPPGDYIIGLRVPGHQTWLWELAYAGPETISVTAGTVVNAAFRRMTAIMPPAGTGFAAVDGDQLHIAWQPVPGAVNYELSLGIHETTGTVSVPIIAETQLTEFVFDVTELRWTVLAESMTFQGSEGQVAAWSLLGYSYPGSNNFVSIKAFDEHGAVAVARPAMEPDTTDHTYFTYESPAQLSPEEKLILERKYDEAIAGLEYRLNNDPGDVTAAMILLNIYRTGTNVQRTYTDLNRSAQIARQLLNQDLPPSVRQRVEQHLSYAERNMPTEMKDEPRLEGRQLKRLL